MLKIEATSSTFRDVRTFDPLLASNGERKTPMKLRRLARWALRAIIPALMGSSLFVGFLPPPEADAAGSPALVGPLLQTLYFGDGLAVPEVCGLTVGVIGAGAAYVPGSGAELSPFLAELNSDCSKIATEGQAFIAQWQAASAPLEALNPVLAPEIAQIGQGVQAFGTNYSASLGPFGPTVAGLGNTIDFFEGS
jgi:hypothetical protein